MESDLEIEQNDVMEGEDEATLETLDPDSWNNIPFCLVQGIKFCKESCLSSIKHLDEISVKMERTFNQQKNTNHVFNTQLASSETRLKNKIEDLERYARKMVNESISMVTSKSEYIESQQEEIKNQIKKVSAQVDTKLEDIFSKDEVKEFIFDQIKANLENVVKNSLKTQRDELELLITSSLRVDGLIGPDQRYSSLKDWICDAQRKFEQISQKNTEKVDKLKYNLNESIESIQKCLKDSESASEIKIVDLEQKITKIVKDSTEESHKYREDNRKETSKTQKKLESQLQELHQKFIKENEKIHKLQEKNLYKMDTFKDRINEIENIKLKELDETSKQLYDKIYSLQSTIENSLKQNQKSIEETEKESTPEHETLIQSDKISLGHSFDKKETILSNYSKKGIPNPPEDILDSPHTKPLNKKLSMLNNSSPASKNTIQSQLTFSKKPEESNQPIASLQNCTDPQKMMHNYIKNHLKKHSNEQMEEFRLILENSKRNSGYQKSDFGGDGVDLRSSQSDLNIKKKSRKLENNFGNRQLRDEEAEDSHNGYLAHQGDITPLQNYNSAAHDFISKMAMEIKSKAKSGSKKAIDELIQEQKKKELAQDKSQISINLYKKSKKVRLAEENSQRRAMRLNEMLKNPITISHKRSVSTKRSIALDQNNSAVADPGLMIDAIGYQKGNNGKLGSIFEDQNCSTNDPIDKRSKSIAIGNDAPIPPLSFPPIKKSNNAYHERFSSFDTSPKETLYGENSGLETGRTINKMVPSIKYRKKMVKKNKQAYRTGDNSPSQSFVSPVQTNGATLDNLDSRYITSINSKIEITPRNMHPAPLHMKFEGLENLK
ncbi:unnamed protein product [Moneuplotes crassus]|uniref:Uncharacterized protein n=1 Tax=Euplotes crassus TaxID=5936 RepID=A0AAD1Y014_EUPCR|nr:unnamed protein product [Moneuplotes crassus]